MGWSATRDACETYDGWTKACVDRWGVQNSYTVNGSRYFFETGKEQRDGAIVGSVFKFREGDEQFADRAGTFRIDPDGTVKRWPTKLKEAIA